MRRSWAGWSLFLLAVFLPAWASRIEAVPESPSDSVSVLDPDLEVLELEENLWLVRSTHVLDSFGPVTANGLVVAGADGVWVIDTPWTDRLTTALFDWIEQDVGPLLGVVATHFHDDRLGGAAEAHRRSLETWAHDETPRLAVREGLEPPRRTLTDRVELSVGGERFEVFYPGAGHTRDNTVVWFPHRRLLFGGCMIKSAGAKSAGFVGDAVLADWPASLGVLAQRYAKAKTVVPGHGAPGSLDLINHTEQLVEAQISQ